MSKASRKIILSESRVQRAVGKITRSALAWLRREKQHHLNLVSVLEGARPFARDLVKCIRKSLPPVQLKLHQVRCRATRGGRLLRTRQWKEVRLDWEALRKHPVLIVDDLADSGLTLRILKKEIRNRGAGDVKTAVLISKYKDCREPLDFRGFELKLDRQKLGKKGLKDRWLFGYGMDYKGRYRSLGHVETVDVFETGGRPDGA